MWLSAGNGVRPCMWSAWAPPGQPCGLTAAHMFSPGLFLPVPLHLSPLTSHRKGQQVRAMGGTEWLLLSLASSLVYQSKAGEKLEWLL